MRQHHGLRAEGGGDDRDDASDSGMRINGRNATDNTGNTGGCFTHRTADNVHSSANDDDHDVINFDFRNIITNNDHNAFGCGHISGRSRPPARQHNEYGRH